MFYAGPMYVRPIGRGTMLNELELQPGLEEVLDPGFYDVEIRVKRRLPVPAD